MPLHAIAGGAPTGEAIIYGCCGLPFLLLMFLSAFGVYRRSLSLTWAAFALACLPFLMLMEEVTKHEPSDDWEIVEEQVAAVKATWLSGVCVLGMGVAMLVVVWNKGRERSHRRTETDGPPPT